MATEMLRFLDEHGLSDGSAVAVPLFGPPVASLDLRAMVEARVIPRLREALSQRLAPASPGLLPSSSLLPLPRSLARPAPAPDVDWLADRLASDEEAVVARIDEARATGTTLEGIYRDWLLPTAVHLAEQLAADLRGMAEVTLAFCGLRRLLHRYADAFCAENGQPQSGLRALLVTPAATGQDSLLPVFGLLLMSNVFRREGWDARAEHGMQGPAFRDAVSNEWFDLVEVLANSDRDLDAIASGIRLIRRGSPNPAVGVIVCGSVFHDHPELVRMVGADRCAVDPLSSLTQAEQLIFTGDRRRLS